MVLATFRRELTFEKMSTWICSRTFDHGGIGWRRPMKCLQLHVIFCKRGTNYRALLWKMAYKDKAYFGSWPPCVECLIPILERLFECSNVMVLVHTRCNRELTFENFYIHTYVFRTTRCKVRREINTTMLLAFSHPAPSPVYSTCGGSEKAEGGHVKRHRMHVRACGHAMHKVTNII